MVVASMWCRLLHSEYCYAISEDAGGENISFAVTDFVTVWRAKSARVDFLARLTESNPHLEDVCGQELWELVLGGLRRGEDGEVRLVGGGGGQARLTVVMRDAGCPLRLQADLAKGSALDFFECVTRPLLASVSSLRASETTLCNCLTRKDKEIQEYKLEGGQLLLKYLKTPLFNEEKHRAEFPAFADNFAADVVGHALRAPKKEEVRFVKVEDVKQETFSPVCAEPGAWQEKPGLSLDEPKTSRDEPETLQDEPETSQDEPGPSRDIRPRADVKPHTAITTLKRKLLNL